MYAYWYWSFSLLVLEFLLCSIAMSPICYCLRYPVDGFDILVKLHRLADSCLFESYFDNLLLFGRKYYVASSAFEVLIAPEVANEYRHEFVILIGVHPFLEIDEPLGKPDGFIANEVRTIRLLATLGGIDQFQECTQLLMSAKSQLAQATVCHWAICM